MSANSKIEWTDASWNPIRARNKATGKIGWHCEHVTTGCEGCYAETMNIRLGTGLPFKPGHRKDIEIFLDENMLLAPLSWKKPKKIFVCSMTDLFADFVTDEWIDKMFAVMALCQQHAFQVLTKRPQRMRSHLADWDKQADIWERAINIGGTGTSIHPLPLPNVWLGVSCERQEEADERIPHLLNTPAAVRFVSAEPLLGPITLDRISTPGNGLGWFDAFASPDHCLDWIIVGGESGKEARPMHPQWAESIRDQCQAAGVKFFFKQWGEWAPYDRGRADGSLLATPNSLDAPMQRFGKKLAGRLLNGREHNDFPQVSA